MSDRSESQGQIATCAAVPKRCRLTTVERFELTKCEATIGRGLTTFVDVGLALLAIRDRRLYRETHPVSGASDIYEVTERRSA